MHRVGNLETQKEREQQGGKKKWVLREFGQSWVLRELGEVEEAAKMGELGGSLPACLWWWGPWSWDLNLKLFEEEGKLGFAHQGFPGLIISTSLWVAFSPTQAWMARLSAMVLRSIAYCKWKWSQARDRSSLVPLTSSLSFSLQFSTTWDNLTSSPKPAFSLCLHLKKYGTYNIKLLLAAVIHDQNSLSFTALVSEEIFFNALVGVVVPLHQSWDPGPLCLYMDLRYCCRWDGFELCIRTPRFSEETRRCWFPRWRINFTPSTMLKALWWWTTRTWSMARNPSLSRLMQIKLWAPWAIAHYLQILML